MEKFGEKSVRFSGNPLLLSFSFRFNFVFETIKNIYHSIYRLKFVIRFHSPIRSRTMYRGRPTRAATASRAQQVATQVFDFKPEMEEEIAGVFIIPGLLS